MARKAKDGARIIAVDAANAHGYRWRWRSADERTSDHDFELFHDCLADARKHGFEVELGPPPPELNPGYFR